MQSRVQTGVMALDEVRDRLEKELVGVMDRLRQLGGAVMIEEFPGLPEDSSQLSELADKVQVREEREISFATRSLLAERANRLAEALERLRGGEYGVCEECGEAIARPRLQAVPEVTTCVRCQEQRERTGQRAGRAPASVWRASGKRGSQSPSRRSRELA